MNHALATAVLAAIGWNLHASHDDGFDRIDAALELRATEGRFAGVVVVAKGGESLYSRAFGEASVELAVPHSIETRFKLHSLSKPLLATVVLRSVDAEKVALDALVGEYLAEWPPAWSDVTVRHLLTHTSGIPDFAERCLSGWTGSALETWNALAPGLASMDPAFEPGSSWAYSNAGYVLLAAVLEFVWKEPLAAILAAQLARPAGMVATELEVTPPWDSIAYDGHVVLAGLANGYNGSPSVLQVAHSKMYAIPGAGGIVTNAVDLVAFTHALFEGDLLAEPTRRAMTEVLPEQSVPYALGWIVRERDGRTVYVHDGGNNGFVTSLEYYPEEQLTIVILCNLGFVPMGALRDEVAELTLAAIE